VPPHVLVPFFQYALWAALTPLIFRLAVRVGLDRHARIGRVLLLLAVGVVVAVAADMAFWYLRFELFGDVVPSRPTGAPGRPPPGPLTGILRLWFLDDFALYLAVLGAGFARYYSLRLRARHEDALRLETEAARLGSQLSDARLTSLRAQLDPHFLFNTLNAVSALVDVDPAGVRRMIARLSELLRWSLEGAGAPETSVEQEVAFAERYLEIMKIRFEGALQTETRVEPDVFDALVPTLLLQPLVENAVKHGIAEGERGARVEIAIRREGDDVVLQVLDDGGGPDGPIRENVGLRNTRERLEAFYGSAFTLEVAARPEGGTRAEVRLPYHTAADLRATVMGGDEA